MNRTKVRAIQVNQMPRPKGLEWLPESTWAKLAKLPESVCATLLIETAPDESTSVALVWTAAGGVMRADCGAATKDSLKALVDAALRAGA
jgi:hypothetical protein